MVSLTTPPVTIMGLKCLNSRSFRSSHSVLPSILQMPDLRPIALLSLTSRARRGFEEPLPVRRLFRFHLLNYLRNIRE